MRLLEQDNAGEVLLVAPDLLLTEFASATAKRCRRKQILDREAREAFHLLEETAPMLFETQQLLGGALDLALERHMSLWDCVYLALAIELDCPMITADRRLFRGHAPRHPAIRLLH